MMRVTNRQMMRLYATRGGLGFRIYTQEHPEEGKPIAGAILTPQGTGDGKVRWQATAWHADGKHRKVEDSPYDLLLLPVTWPHPRRRKGDLIRGDYSSHQHTSMVCARCHLEARPEEIFHWDLCGDCCLSVSNPRTWSPGHEED